MISPTELLRKTNRTYKEMLEVFISYKRDNKKQKYFSAFTDGTTTDLHYKLLDQELKTLARIHTEKPILPKIQKKEATVHDVQTEIQIKPIISKPRLLIDTNPSVRFDELSTEMQELYKENSKLTSDFKTLHANLKTATTDEKRKEIAEEICRIETKRDRNWKIIDEWYLNSANSEKQEIVNEGKTTDVVKNILAAKRYLERYKNSKKPAQMKKCEDYRKYLESVGGNK